MTPSPPATPRPTDPAAPDAADGRPPTRRDAVRQAVAVALIGAGTIHLALGPEHMSQWKVLGVGFFASGLLQVLLGARLLAKESRLLLATAGATSLSFVAVWAISRTTGLPLGPEAGVAEAVGRADLICMALEAAAALGALTLLRRPLAGLAPAGRWALRGLVSAAALVVVAGTGVALAAPSHSHREGPTEGQEQSCPASPVSTGVDANGNGADDGVEAYFACQLRHSHDSAGHGTGAASAEQPEPAHNANDGHPHD